MNTAPSRPTDILLVKIPEGRHRGFQETLGLACLKSALSQHGFSAAIYSPFHNPFFGQYHIEHVDEVIENMQRQIRLLAPHVVGLSGNSGAPFETVADAVKQADPKCRIICGGHGATLAHSELAEHSNIDIVVRGEGEETLAEAMDAVRNNQPLDAVSGINFRRGGEVVVNPDRPLIERLDALPLPDRSYLDADTFGDGVAFIYSSRGCPHACAFCDSRLFYGKNVWRARPAANVVDEMEQLNRTIGIDRFNFVDDDFLPTREAGQRLLEIHRLVRERDFFCRISAQANVRGILMNREALVSTGTFVEELNVGVESGSQWLLDRWRKPQTVEEIVAVASLLRTLGIRSHFYFILADHETPLEKVRESLFVFLNPENFFIFANLYGLTNSMTYYRPETAPPMPAYIAFLKRAFASFEGVMPEVNLASQESWKRGDSVLTERLCSVTRRYVEAVLAKAGEVSAGRNVPSHETDAIFDSFLSEFGRIKSEFNLKFSRRKPY